MTLRASPIIVSLLLAIAGCDRGPLRAPDLVLSVADEEILYSDFESYAIANTGGLEAIVDSDALSGLFDQFVAETLLARLARDHRLVPESVGRRAAAAQLLSTISSAEVSEQEIAAYYQENPQRFELPDRVLLSQILVEDRETAEQVVERLEAGEEFAELALRFSIDPGRTAGGDQGELSRKDLPPSLVEPIFGLEPGETSPVIAAEYGYHVFLVRERRAAEHLSLAAASESIRRTLERMYGDEELARLVEEARERYNPQVYEENLPFSYRGLYRDQSPS